MRSPAHRRSRARYRPNQRGQASVLGVVALVVVAIGMYTSYRISRTVYEKIALQNAADAAAYSLATQAARTFNFVAFSNRALVAKQVELLELHASVSSATYSAGMLGYMGDVALTYGRSLQAAGATAQFGFLLEQVGQGLIEAHRLRSAELETALLALEVALGAEPAFSKLYAGMSAGLVATTAARLLEGVPDIVVDNDPFAEPHSLARSFNAYNTYAFLDSFETGAFRRDPDAQRAFAELVNGSRIASGSPRQNLVHRAGLLQQLTGSLAELSEITSEESLTENDSFGIAGRLNRLATDFGSFGFVGTTKLLTRRGNFADLADSGSNQPDHSWLTRGDVLVSKDVLAGMASIPALVQAAADGFASLQSARNGFRYCRYEQPKAYGTGNFSRVSRLLSDPEYAGFICDDRVRQNLRWSGIGRYLRFRSKSSADAVARPSNQPDVWVILSKDDRTLNGPKAPSFDAVAGVSAGNRLGPDTPSAFSAISRAQVYYHRPGAWKEPPNLFNPYWGARLAPKSEASDRVLERLGVGKRLAHFFSDNAVMF